MRDPTPWCHLGDLLPIGIDVVRPRADIIVFGHGLAVEVDVFRNRLRAGSEGALADGVGKIAAQRARAAPVVHATDVALGRVDELVHTAGRVRHLDQVTGGVIHKSGVVQEQTVGGRIDAVVQVGMQVVLQDHVAE